MMAAMEPLLYAAGVDIAFAGHVHAYERTVCSFWCSLSHYLIVPLDLFVWLLVRQKRVFGGRSDPCGAVHITVGDGGNREGLATKYDFRCQFL